MTLYAGLDLSKNHYGFSFIQPDGTVVLAYTRIKDMTKKEMTEHSDLDYYYDLNLGKEVPGFRFLTCVIHTNTNLNKVMSDKAKSYAINLTIKEILKMEETAFNDDDVFLSLEDYIVMNNGIVSLVHTTEQFKYDFLNDKGKDKTLFLCCNASWKKLLGSLASKKPTGKDRYENIKLSIKNNQPNLWDFLSMIRNSTNEDTLKDLIDSWALAMAGTHKDEPSFKINYAKRLFTNERKETHNGHTERTRKDKVSKTK